MTVLAPRPPRKCINCAAPGDHPPVTCPICGHRTNHLQSTVVHMVSEHVVEGPRHQSLLTDVMRAAVRGWPIEPTLQRCREAGLEVVGVEAFA
jgi:hypothetical protein